MYYNCVQWEKSNAGWGWGGCGYHSTGWLPSSDFAMAPLPSPVGVGGYRRDLLYFSCSFAAVKLVNLSSSSFFCQAHNLDRLGFGDSDKLTVATDIFRMTSGNCTACVLLCVGSTVHERCLVCLQTMQSCIACIVQMN